MREFEIQYVVEKRRTIVSVTAENVMHAVNKFRSEPQNHLLIRNIVSVIDKDDKNRI